jgi:hypothetical protein
LATRNVEPAESFDRSLHRVVAGNDVGKIAGNQQAFRACCFDGHACFLGVRLLHRQIADRDVRPFARIEQGDRAADAGIASSYQCDLPSSLRAAR